MTPPEAQAMPDSVWLFDDKDSIGDLGLTEVEHNDGYIEYLKKSTITAQLKAGDELAAALSEAYKIADKEVNLPGDVDSRYRALKYTWMALGKALASYASVREGK